MKKSVGIGEHAQLFFDNIRTSFWFIPALLLCCASVLAFFTLWLDVRVLPNTKLIKLDWVDPSKLQGVRGLLSTTAAAILGVAGVSFSITIASLTLASQQFGPRLIRNFMQDRFTQTVLGFFVATFLYCMLTVQISSIIVESAYTPLSTLMVVLVLTVIDLVLLVLFIHHISVSIQADSVISEIAAEMRERADSLFSNDLQENPESDEDQVNQLLSQFKDKTTQVRSEKDGYIRAIDYGELTTIADDEGLLINVVHRAGDYLLNHAVLVEVTGRTVSEETNERIVEQFIIGPSRNPQQDLEFSIRQLVEVALRALSPGINDPFTAITCIDRLGSLINMISERAIPSRLVYNENNEVRLIIDTTTFQGLVDAAFHQIRQGGTGHVDVTIRLLDVIHDVCRLAKSRQQALALFHQAHLIHVSSKTTDCIEHDKQAILDRFNSLSLTLKDRFDIIPPGHTNE